MICIFYKHLKLCLTLACYNLYMQQIVFIHGGTAFNSYDRFLDNLKTKTVYKDRLTYQPMWFHLLDKTLASSAEVLLPSMPNKQNASFKEWSIWFDRLQDVIEKDAILIGHSLGAIFLAKYLAGNELKKPAKAIMMLAGPYNDESIEDLGGFTIEPSDGLENIYKSTKDVVLVHAPNDPVVNIDEQHRYQKVLPMAEYVQLDGPDHFMRPEFPEMVELIQSVIDR